MPLIRYPIGDMDRKKDVDTIPETDRKEITCSVRRIMGDDFNVDFKQSDNIETSSNNKYFYTICGLK